jgi:hypothetical protein
VGKKNKHKRNNDNNTTERTQLPQNDDPKFIRIQGEDTSSPTHFIVIDQITGVSDDGVELTINLADNSDITLKGNQAHMLRDVLERSSLIVGDIRHGKLPEKDWSIQDDEDKEDGEVRIRVSALPRTKDTPEGHMVHTHSRSRHMK